MVIPSSVRGIRDSAFFFGCTGLSDVGIVDGVRSIDVKAFAGCVDLTVRMPASISYIVDNAFSEGKDITITAPNKSFAHRFTCTHNIHFISL